GTPEGDRLDVIATLIDAFEAEHFPMDPPDPVDAIRFRMEQQGLTRRDLGGNYRHPNARSRSPEPQARSFHRHDSATARAIRHLGGSTDSADPERLGLTKQLGLMQYPPLPSRSWATEVVI